MRILRTVPYRYESRFGFDSELSETLRDTILNAISDERLTVYYSNQRNHKQGQEFIHQTTEDNFESWETPVDIVASAKYEDCPGMFAITEVLSYFNHFTRSVVLK